MMYGYGRGYGGMMGYGGSWLLDLLWFLFLVAILAGVVILIIWVVRSMTGAHGGTGTPTQMQQPQQQPPATQAGATSDEACAIARKRYASGEITKEQFEEICKTLGV
jgi:putative membrane protein